MDKRITVNESDVMNLCNFLKHDAQSKVTVEFSEQILEAAKMWGLRESYELRWEGWCQKDHDKQKMELERMWFDSAGGLHGNGTDENGYYKLSGFITESSKIGMTKHYLGVQSVEFQAQMDLGRHMEGTWKIFSKDESGRFELARISQLWSGWMEKSGEIKEVEYSISNLEGDKIFYGFGLDDGVFYVLRGERDGNIFKLVKEVQKEIIEYYIGEYDPSSGFVKGNWTNGRDLFGSFEFGVETKDSVERKLRNLVNVN